VRPEEGRRETKPLGTGRRLLAGATWIYGAQLLTVAAQFGYAATTSRLVSPGGFGAYAVALSVTGLVALLAMGGLGQTVARMVDPQRERLRALVTYALLLGLVAGAAIYLTAPLWAWLWGVPSALEPIRWMAINGIVSPLLGLGTGLMARTGKFRRLALITVTSNVTGMLVGAVAVLTWRSAGSLVVSSSIAQILTLIGTLMATEGQLLGLGRPRRGQGDIAFSGKITLASFLSYLTGNITKLSMARGIEAASLGYWNRAEVLTSIPFQQVQTALIRAIYPEFRHDIAGSDRAKEVWTDMLVLAASIALGLSAIVAVLVPPLIPIIFGEGWDTAAALAAPLAIVGGLQLVSTLLASAVEALGRFRWIWSTDAILIILQVCAAILIFAYKNITVAVIALLLTNVVRHAWHVWLAGKSGYLDVRRLLLAYSGIIVSSVGMGAATWLLLHWVIAAVREPIYILWTSALIASLCLFGYGIRERMPVLIIARKYGLMRRRA
jgi:O-antigen/teichoic acid export membrane protein